MAADRTGCCAGWPKPCTYHEGWEDAAELLLELAQRMESAHRELLSRSVVASQAECGRLRAKASGVELCLDYARSTMMMVCPDPPVEPEATAWCRHCGAELILGDGYEPFPLSVDPMNPTPALCKARSAGNGRYLPHEPKATDASR